MPANHLDLSDPVVRLSNPFCCDRQNKSTTHKLLSAHGTHMFQIHIRLQCSSFQCPFQSVQRVLNSRVFCRCIQCLSSERVSGNKRLVRQLISIGGCQLRPRIHGQRWNALQQRWIAVQVLGEPLAQRHAGGSESFDALPHVLTLLSKLGSVPSESLVPCLKGGVLSLDLVHGRGFEQGHLLGKARRERGQGALPKRRLHHLHPPRVAHLHQVGVSLRGPRGVPGRGMRRLRQGLGVRRVRRLRRRHSVVCARRVGTLLGLLGVLHVLRRVAR
mmetsp:Transcript_5830/g.11107  ORF Transcript_5830/g.11107 Transcript_5830/m.11107 type:complete len:273 (+) Transcript_5830:162-980(+)